tara:strand:+ start:133 stop:357 length:225 start_codon:yes stop_codon:yes gene_type:complete
MNEDVFFLAGIVLLSIALYFPVNKLVWVLSVRRLERKYKKKLTDVERKLQLNRARFISIILVIIFSYFFNLKLF